MPSLLAYALLFTGVAAFFIFIHLMLGRFVRPMRMDAEKATIYECGEPTIGSSWVQFDLRFYVVALLFVIFDVEMAFFFPWAVVFGKANTLAKADLPAEERLAMTKELMPPELWPQNQYAAFEDALKNPGQRRAIDPVAKSQDAASRFAWTAFIDILVFFAVLLVGFAYLWKRGDLDWVRSVAAQQPGIRDQESGIGNQESAAIIPVS